MAKDTDTATNMLSDKPVILVANGAEWTVRSLRTVLESGGYSVATASTGRQAVAAALALRPHALIVELALPDVSGLEVCRQLRDQGEPGAVMPIIVTTHGAGERAVRFSVFEAGAWDFCVEPVDGEILLHKLGHFVRSRRAVDRAREEGLLDWSTSLYSRRGLTQRAREMAAGAVRRREALACLVLASRRSSVAGTADEAFAGALIAHLAGVVRRCVRDSDACGRLSKFEIGVLAAATGPAGAARLAERLRRTIEASPLVERRVASTLAIGISAHDNFGAAHLSPLELLDEAAAEARAAARAASHAAARVATRPARV